MSSRVEASTRCDKVLAVEPIVLNASCETRTIKPFHLLKVDDFLNNSQRFNILSLDSLHILMIVHEIQSKMVHCKIKQNKQKTKTATPPFPPPPPPKKKTKKKTKKKQQTNKKKTKIKKKNKTKEKQIEQGAV